MAKEPTAKAENKGKPVPETAIPMHKKLAMGQHPDTGAGSGPKTPA
jgi:hypothetical protein